ncbi:hypothetical protein TPL01_21070 [Sulfuriferula plumbiphila]|uniref:Uncharacterized protein n=1 Tax=Sulfuriferula plumbiphila TaxID=171865 RepID=A0A512L913_9PROT|nr:hypothetical protein [Sulfuriferula plumbiphila]BBP04414.1 hypothetical protein SFPGR_18360 [Sulfuriferula plumbiphila]GEP30969.1 hypothetical protein TPL01_21070 [Sulfuriferula plumbiphila]
MTAENLHSVEQIRIESARACVDALNKMHLILHPDGYWPDQEQYWNSLDDAMALIKKAAGDMSPKVKGVLMVLAEYIRDDLTCGSPRRFAGRVPEAAITHEELAA